MGSMGKRRGRRTKSDEGGRRLDVGRSARGSVPSPWTVEGYIDFIGRALQRGKAKQLPGWLFAVLATACVAVVAFGLLEVVSR